MLFNKALKSAFESNDIDLIILSGGSSLGLVMSTGVVLNKEEYSRVTDFGDTLFDFVRTKITSDKYEGEGEVLEQNSRISLEEYLPQETVS